MLIVVLALGPLATNCYLVADEETGEAAIVDPAAEAERVLSEVKSRALRVRYVVNTHGHLDHVLANEEVREATGAPLLIHRDDAPFLARPDGALARWLGVNPRFRPPEQLLQGGETLSLGRTGLQVLNTPGHTPGGISLYGAGVVFTGDALFNQGVGRTDLPGGDWQRLLASIRGVLFALPDETVVYPGHGPATTIGAEKTGNPYL